MEERSELAEWLGSSSVRGRFVIRREAMVINESVDRQDVKALSIKTREMCLAAFPITSFSTDEFSLIF